MTEFVSPGIPLGQPETLDLKLQIPMVRMVIPNELKELRLVGAEQLPEGDIAYIDAAEPDVIRIAGHVGFKTDKITSKKNRVVTWKPVAPREIEKVFSFKENAGRTFAAIIFHTLPRTPDEKYDSQISQLSGLLNRTTKREDKIIVKQNLGTLFVVENRGVDLHIGWRENQMREHDLVVDRENGEHSVVVAGDYIISQGRKRKKRGPVDLTKGKHSRHMVSPFIKAIEESAARQGLAADTSELYKKAMATNFPLKTLSDLREGGETTYVGQGDSGAITFERSKSGDSATPSKDAFQTATLSPEKKPESLKQNAAQKHFPGQEVIFEHQTCGECKTPLIGKYFEEKGKLKVEISCPHDGLVELRNA